ncbi:MAG: hypothetical protein AAB455_03805 [Patescibacteria group bacterium]
MADEKTEVGSSSSYPKLWEERVGPFAEAVKKSLDAVSQALVGLVGDPSDDALATLADPNAVQDNDLQAVLVGDGPRIPLGVFRKNLALLRGPQAAAATPAAAGSGPSFDILPAVPDDENFLSMLKIGGIIKVGKTEVMAATRAALAESVGVFDLPATIIERMEEFARGQDEPVGDNFFRLQKMLTEKRYGDVLAALGVPGNYVSNRRKQDLLDRLKSGLWPALRSFNDQLKAWQETWSAGMANPAMLLTALAIGQSGARNMMPPGMMQPPDTATIRDAADSVIDRINRVFAGTGIPVARALAYDATRIKGVLEEATLPASIGAANREQMLKMLGVSVSADLVRLEQNVTRYVLAIVEFPKVGAGTEEYSYLGAMIQLGAAIPWDKLPAGSGDLKTTAIPSRRPRINHRVGIGVGSDSDDSGDDA